MSRLIRTFIAIDVPIELKRNIAAVQDQLRQIRTDKVTWARGEGIHLTLKFLGDVEQERLEQVTEAVRLSAEGIPPFELTTTGCGGFPNLKRPRVLWLGITEQDSLMQLQRNVEHRLSAVGFPAEDKRFHPHLTIGRVRFIDRHSTLVTEFQNCVFPVVRWAVTSLKVMSSELKPEGARYEVIAALQL